jgi:hypothetical protein
MADTLQKVAVRELLSAQAEGVPITPSQAETVAKDKIAQQRTYAKVAATGFGAIATLYTAAIFPPAAPVVGFLVRRAIKWCVSPDRDQSSVTSSLYNHF